MKIPRPISHDEKRPIAEPVSGDCPVRTVDLIEAGALALWHRFAPGSHLEWEDEPHKSEYRLAAEEVLAIAMETRRAETGNTDSVAKP